MHHSYQSIPQGNKFARVQHYIQFVARSSSLSFHSDFLLHTSKKNFQNVCIQITFNKSHLYLACRLRWCLWKSSNALSPMYIKFLQSPFIQTTKIPNINSINCRWYLMLTQFKANIHFNTESNTFRFRQQTGTDDWIKCRGRSSCCTERNTSLSESPNNITEIAARVFWGNPTRYWFHVLVRCAVAQYWQSAIWLQMTANITAKMLPSNIFKIWILARQRTRGLQMALHAFGWTFSGKI